MIRRQFWLERIRGVEKEYRAAFAAVTLLVARVRSDPVWMRDQDWDRRDADRLRTNLEATYFIRLYSEFESGLREVWSRHFQRSTQPPMRDLLVGAAAKRVSEDAIDAADAVRRYRNRLIHRSDDENVDAVTLADARHHLCRYLSYLPDNW